MEVGLDAGQRGLREKGKDVFEINGLSPLSSCELYERFRSLSALHGYTFLCAVIYNPITAVRCYRLEPATKDRIFLDIDISAHGDNPSSGNSFLLHLRGDGDDSVLKNELRALSDRLKPYKVLDIFDDEPAMRLIGSRLVWRGRRRGLHLFFSKGKLSLQFQEQRLRRSLRNQRGLRRPLHRQSRRSLPFKKIIRSDKRSARLW